MHANAVKHRLDVISAEHGSSLVIVDRLNLLDDLVESISVLNRSVQRLGHRSQMLDLRSLGELRSRGTEGSNRGRDVGLSIETSGDDVVLKHLLVELGLHSNFLGVLIPKNVGTGLDLVSAEDTEGLEQLDVLLAVPGSNGLRSLSQVGKTQLLGLRLPLVRVVVAVEDGALVLDEDVLNDLANSRVGIHADLSGFDFVGNVSDGISEESVQHNVGTSNGLGGTCSSELELVLSEGERRGSVSVGTSSLDVRKGNDTHINLQRGFLLDSLLEVLVNSNTDIRTEEDGHDGWRSFVGAKSEIVGGTGNAGSQEIAVHVDRANGSGNHQEEGDVLLRLVARSKQAGNLPIEGGNKDIPHQYRWRNCCAYRNR